MLQLPNEIWLRILDFIHYTDLEAFAICNKRINAVANDALRRHLELKAKYSTLNFWSNRSGDIDTIDFLGKLCTNTDLKYYPKKFQLTWNSGMHSSIDDRDLIWKATPELAELIENSPVFEHVCAYKRRTILNHPGRGYAPIPLALFFDILPNLCSIQITTDWDRDSSSDDVIWNVFSYVASSSDRPNQVNQGCPALQEVILDGENNGTSSTLLYFVPFTRWSSTKMLKGNGILGRGKDRRFHPNWSGAFSGHHSMVTEIYLTNSSIDGYTFEIFLKHIVALRKFTYHHGGRGCGHDHEPQHIVGSLRLHAIKSLELLDLTADQRIWGLENRMCQGIGSLRMFRKLTVVRADDWAFELPVTHGEKMHEIDSGQGDQTNDPEDDERLVERLIDVLPKAVQALCIVIDMNEEELFSDMVAMHKKRLPHLRKIDFEGPDVIDEDIKKALQSSGILFSSGLRNA